MSRTRKANIRPDLWKEFFTDGERVYQLESCETEPYAIMIPLGGDEVPISKPISYFANFVQLKPIRPIEKPKKPRADLGKTHRKAKSGALSGFSISQTTSEKEPVFENIRKRARKKGTEEEREIADKKGDNLTIHTPTGLGDDTEYRVNIAGKEATGPTLKSTVLIALEGWKDRISGELSEQEQATIQGILDATITDPRD